MTKSANGSMIGIWSWWRWFYRPIVKCWAWSFDCSSW